MNYHYEYYADSEEGLVAMLLFYGIYILFWGGLNLGLYILRSFGTYTIAKRRGLKHAWFAWVPVANQYLLGCISDQYQYVVKGKDKSKRKWLLGLNIVSFLLSAVVVFLALGMMVNLVGGAMAGYGENRLAREAIRSAMGIMGSSLPLSLIAIAAVVLHFMALYDLYTSCDPENKILYLLLSIFVGVTEPFFIFFIRNKDAGMPPRKDAESVHHMPDPPVWEPEREEEPWKHSESEPEMPFWQNTENTTE